MISSGAVAAGDHRDSDRDAERQGFAVVHEDAARDQVDQPRRRVTGLGFVGMGKEDSELVAADARDDVAFAHPVGQQSRDLDQRLVAGAMAKAVVDHLQPVEVDVEHRRTCAVAAGAVDEALERAQEAAPVRQIDQRILVRERVELLDPLLERGDLAAQPIDLVDRPTRPPGRRLPGQTLPPEPIWSAFRVIARFNTLKMLRLGREDHLASIPRPSRDCLAKIRTLNEPAC